MVQGICGKESSCEGTGEATVPTAFVEGGERPRLCCHNRAIRPNGMN
ncbi:MAG: hypothetical protein M2R45_04551 [Verrucomicrobia subdivision 3 bacterium]|nr:hypothetical protein [Limisphaerales bacterium]MCS1416810.1 hypothetical protein [Limisphaerales bacterium]